MEKNYLQLQLQVNELIKKTGSVAAAIDFLASALPGSNDKRDMSILVTFSVANFFGVEPDDIINEDGKTNSSYRMICYQIHKDCLGLSIRKTAKIYKRQENAVWIGLKRMKEVIEKPSLDIKSYECFVFVKGQILKSIKYLNKENGKDS